MDRDILLKAFEAGSMPLTLEEIEMIMDEEMAKDPSEMDGDLVEMCLDILTKATVKCEDKADENSETAKQENGKNKKRIKLKRMLLFAAVIAVLLGFAVPVCAKYIKSDASSGVVKYKANHFEIDLSAENNKAVNYSDESIDIIQALNEKGIENVILPSELLKEEYVKTISFFDNDNNYFTIEISFNNGEGIEGKIGITKHKTEDSEFMIGQINASGNYDSVKQLSLNGMDILVFSDEKNSFIEYIDNNIEYFFALSNCDLDSALEIAKTLG